MTRAEQDAILVPITMAYRLLAGPTDEPCGGYRPLIDDLASFRASLRLDDPKLRAICDERAGQTWPWSTEMARV